MAWILAGLRNTSETTRPESVCVLSFRMLKRVLGAALGGLLLSASGNADAFSTRVHIALANDLRDSLIASGTNDVPLRFGTFSVTLSQEDADAIRNHPLEFRAGAVGPDNTAFPGMTDPSHAIGQRPFEQCELLYKEALLPAEKAYAMGCFLHGSTDAVAHHYVNYMTGETFTLNPLSADRASDFSNVIRHIAAESMIQEALLTKAPTAFEGTRLSHAIPKSFVQRAYFDEKSVLWQLVAKHAKSKLDASKQANPGATLVTVIQNAGLAPADHLVLTPLYLREIDDERVATRASVTKTIADLQNPGTPDGAKLGVTAGTDGKLGTSDDKTACWASCPTIYAKYKVYVGLLEPRFDAGNNPLPSAFDKLSDKLRDDLFKFLPAYLDTVENLSNKLNEPIAPGTDGLSVTKAELAGLFSPMTTWSNNLTTIDYAALTQALLPQWLISLQNALNAVGVNIQVPSLIAALLDPVIQPVKDAVKKYAIEEAEQFIGSLVDEYKKEFPPTKVEFENRLATYAPTTLGGTVLDNILESGLYGHSFNIASVSIADHRAVLPIGNDPIGIGPATFDASHTVSWMQVGACSYLAEAVFPLGIDAIGAMSVRTSDGTTHKAVLPDDSPIECHDGSLSSFTSSPTTINCALTDLDTLVSSSEHRGSLSRSYPPEHSDKPATCTGISITGLPDPPPGIGGSGGAGGNGGNGGSGASVGSQLPSSGGEDSGGCGCRTTPVGGSTPHLLILLGLTLALARRRTDKTREQS